MITSLSLSPLQHLHRHFSLTSTPSTETILVLYLQLPSSLPSAALTAEESAADDDEGEEVVCME
jgi:hypothetical protein